MKTIEDNAIDFCGLSNLSLNDLNEHFHELPTVLFVCNVHENTFTEASYKHEFEQMFQAFGPSEFVYLPSFRRVRVNYQTPQEAAKAKISLHETYFKELQISVYFAQISTPIVSTSTNLLPPVPDKQFLISPPASPPVGWEPVHENKPAFNFDLLSTVYEMAPGQSHELHKATNNTPSVVVHVCENFSQSNSDSAQKMKIQQTRRPEY